MSLPIAIPRATSSASSSSSVASSPSSAPTSLSSAGVYVPVHKRTGSSSASVGSSSRAPSPTSARFPSLSEVQRVHPRIYSTDLLLSLRPKADESMKEKIRASCPELAMNRRMRKSLEFQEHQRVKALSHSQAPSHQYQQQPLPSPPSVSSSASAPTRALPRRNRPAGRGPERRRQVLQSLSVSAANDSWRGMRATVQPLSVV